MMRTSMKRWIRGLSGFGAFFLLTTLLVYGQTSGVEIDRTFQDLAQHMSDSVVLNDLAKLAPISTIELPNKFASFRAHINDASRINSAPADGAVKANAAKLSRQTQNLMQNALSPFAAGIPAGQLARASLLNMMTPGKAWASLDALENDQNYATADLLAQSLWERETDPALRDRLALVAARNAWLADAKVGGDSRYSDLLNQACQSKVPEVAAQGQLWREATTVPQSAEALLLAHQIWETVHIDLHQREKSGYLSYLICGSGQAVYNVELNGPREQAAKEAMLGRIVGILSEAAFQIDRRDLLDWAVATVPVITQAAPEDKLLPRYYLAYHLYTRRDYTGARGQFEQVFFSGTVSDTAAKSGLMAANCYTMQNDVIGALAILNLANQLYSTQRFVMPAANHELERLRKKAENTDPKLLTQFIETHYKTRLEKALAEKIKTQPTRQLAGL